MPAKMCILDLFRLQMEVRVKKRKDGVHLRHNRLVSSSSVSGNTSLASTTNHRGKKGKSGGACMHPGGRSDSPCLNPACGLHTSELGSARVSPYSSVKTLSTQFTEDCKGRCHCKDGHKSCSKGSKSGVMVANFIDVDENEDHGKDNLGFVRDSLSCGGTVNRCSFLNRYRKKLKELQEEEEREAAKKKQNGDGISSTLRRKRMQLLLPFGNDRVIPATDPAVMPDPDR